MNVIKRDGTEENFDKTKIESAVLRAFKDVMSKYNGLSGITDEYAIHKAKEISDYVEGLSKQLTVEEIQDIVEDKLMSCKAANVKVVAKAYIKYRYDREKIRRNKTPYMKEIASKLLATNIQNQNANVDEGSFGGRKGEANSVLLKNYALDNCMSEMSRNNHLNNEIYIHDLDSYAVGEHNCLSIPFDTLLKYGFNTRQTDVRPANSINTACQLIAVLFQIQSLQQYGGCSATHLDHTLVPYVRKSFYKHFKDSWKYIYEEEFVEPDGFNPEELSIDSDEYKYYAKGYRYAMDKTEKELNQAIEGMYHNLNTLQSRSGNQLPFTSINFGTCTSVEGRMVIKALIEGCMAGVGKFHKTSIFPCGIFQCMKGINRSPGDPNYDMFQLALKCTAKRLYPNYANVDWSGNAGYDVNDPKTYFSTMGCRTANGYDINHEDGVNPQTKDGRGNICPVTIILPSLAMKAALSEPEFVDDTEVEQFMRLLDEKIHEAKDMLIERFDYVCSQPVESASFMYENGTMIGYKPEEGIRSALKHGTLALGQLGLAEALQILIGKDHTTEEGMVLAKRIEQLFKDRCAEFKQEYKLNFGVYYTPAENLCYTAMKKFKQRFGEIPNVSDREFFTNSIHVPVWKEISPFEKIDIESQLTGYSSAGCITYVELDSGAKNNIEALEQIVNYAMDKDIPYFAINVPNDTCLSCGYCDEFNDSCPECGSENIQQLRRVTGYLTGNYKTAFNYGKQKEVEARYKHSNKLDGWSKDA